MNFDTWKLEIEEKAKYNGAVLIEGRKLFLDNIKHTVQRAEALQYLPKETALTRLQKEHEYLAKQYGRWLRASKVAQQDSDTLTLFASTLLLIEAALELVRDALQFAQSGDAEVLFSETADTNILTMDSDALCACWRADPSFDCLRYIAYITGRTRRDVVKNLRTCFGKELEHSNE